MIRGCGGALLQARSPSPWACSIASNSSRATCVIPHKHTQNGQKIFTHTALYDEESEEEDDADNYFEPHKEYEDVEHFYRRVSRKLKIQDKIAFTLGVLNTIATAAFFGGACVCRFSPLTVSITRLHLGRAQYHCHRGVFRRCVRAPSPLFSVAAFTSHVFLRPHRHLPFFGGACWPSANCFSLPSAFFFAVHFILCKAALTD